MIAREKSNRDRHDIIAGILQSCIQGERITNVMHITRTNYKSLQKYMSLLVEKQLVAIEGNLYVTTDQGQEYLDAYNAQITARKELVTNNHVLESLTKESA